MQTTRVFSALALTALLASTALAGGDGKKCQYTGQQCLDHMAAYCAKAGWVGGGPRGVVGGGVWRRCGGVRFKGLLESGAGPPQRTTP